MKYVFLCIILMCYIKVDSQNKLNIDEDPILSKIISKIPSNWTYYIKDNNLIFESKDSVYVLKENFQNIKKLGNKIDDVVREKGQKMKSRVIFRFEPIWDINKIVEAQNNNNTIIAKKMELDKKYKIMQYADNKKTTREKIVFRDNLTDKEKNIVENYEKELKELYSKYINMPSYHSTLYSWFVEKQEGCYTSEYIVVPEEISLQNYLIVSLFSELCAK